MNRVNWLVLTLIGLTFLYFFINNERINSESENNEYSYYNKYLFGGGGEIPGGLGRASPISPYHIENKEIKKIIPESELWRTHENNINATVDKVANLMKWIEDLSNTSYLQNARPKRILVFDGMDNYYGTDGKIKCPFNNSELLSEKCIIKEDKLLDIPNYGEYDAFVSVRNWRHVIYDRKISSVKHVFFIEESPFVVKYADFEMNNAILASYSRGSDIVLPYGYFSKFKNAQPKNIRNYAKGKSKFAAIIVSNCDAKNARLKYVEELSKYIPVHIYGACGPYKCDQNCFETVKKEYKFYLAFEKANCKDYITEKFWANALKYDTLPITMGAHPDDYKALAPPNSYIHVEDFASPKELANYLIKVDKNDTLYNSYFSWKTQGRVIGIWKEFFCRLCGILFYSDFYETPVWPKGSTWGTVNHCLPINKWYWTRES